MSSLYTELMTDPMGLGYATYVSSGNVVALYDLIHDYTKFTLPGWISVASFETWCSENNAEYLNIETTSANTGSPYYAMANSLMRRLNRGTKEDAFNLNDPKIIALFNNWPFVDTTGATKASLIALGTYPASRAQVLAIPATMQDISTAIGYP